MPLGSPPESTSLPALLRLAPYRSVRSTGPGGRLLGLDPATALAVDGLAPALAEMLDELGVPVPRGELVGRAIARGATATEAEALLCELLAAGAVVDAGQEQRRGRHRAGSVVVVSGRGPLGVGIVAGLVQAGVGTVYTETGGRVRADDLGTGFLDADRGADRLAATRAAVHRVMPSTGTGPPPLRTAPDLMVLADTAPEPAHVAALMSTAVAHLLVRMRDGVGVVGPLVLPGRSACLGCLEIRRTARDPAWPSVAAGLVGCAGRADQAGTAATAALGTAQALAALDGTAGGPAPPTLDATLELHAGAGTLRRRRWAPEPTCRCGAATTPGQDGRGRRHGRATSASRQLGDTIMM